MEKANESLGLVLHEASRAVRKAFERRVAPQGLSSAQWRMMVVVVKQGGATQARLADLLEIEPISVSRLIDRMEAAGWVERHPDPQDRRAKIVMPTDRAHAAHAEIRAIADEVYAEALNGLGPEERRLLMGGLNRVLANLNNAAARAAEGEK